jgi:glutamate N-acetyltransferase / amino-acid N-acetyltransferase
MLRALRPAASARQGVVMAVVSARAGMSTYANAEEYLASLAPHAVLPSGFRVGTQGLEFRPREVPDRPAKMTMTLIALDKPTDKFAAMFTSNSFPGAPVIVGRKRLAESPQVQAIVINNKISNVCAPGGVDDSEAVCAAVAKALKLPGGAQSVIPSSTGIIGCVLGGRFLVAHTYRPHDTEDLAPSSPHPFTPHSLTPLTVRYHHSLSLSLLSRSWKLPVADMLAAIPTATGALQSASVLPAAKGICTTDLYAKVRSAVVPGTNGGRIVGIAKGAGMIEPNLATMLVYVLTDVAVPRDALRAMLPRAVDGTFNALTIDSDQSTSDTVVAVSSGVKPIAPEGYAAFEAALTSVCASLSEDIVRNGEGVQHVIRVQVRGATTKALARAVGKSIVNSPLFKCAVAGNDPNVGRLVAAIGKCVGVHPDGGRDLDMSRATLKMGGLEIFSKGQFRLTPDVERTLVKHMRDAQLWGE